jgi:hypothetical protein
MPPIGSAKTEASAMMKKLLLSGIAALFLATGTAHAAARGQCRASDGVGVSFDWAAARLGIAIERVAEALLVEEEAVTPGSSS